MVIEQILSRINSLYSKGVPSDESRLSDRHIYNKMLTVRQYLIAQQVKKRQKISDANYSILPCVELIKVPRHECACLGNIGCDVFRTKEKLPKILTDLNKHIIEYVMSIDRGMRIEEMDRTAILYIKGNKYTSKSLKYVIENRYLYFPVATSPGVVSIKFLAEDPLEAANFPSFCGNAVQTDCTPYAEREFPIDGDMLEPLIEMTYKECVAIFNQSTEDKNNDSSDKGQEPRG